MLKYLPAALLEHAKGAIQPSESEDPALKRGREAGGMSVPEVQIPFLRTDPASFERRVNTLIGRKPRMPPPIRLMRQGDPQRTTGSEAPLSQDRSAAASYSQGNAVVPPAAPPRPLSWHGLSPASSMVMTPGVRGQIWDLGPLGVVRLCYAAGSLQEEVLEDFRAAR